jgi:CheY-like chemotaxis protein
MRILVAEDEGDIRDMYYMVLVARGHEVILTSDGEECLEVYLYRRPQQQQLQGSQEGKHDDGKKNSSSFSYFDVVILDYKMPKKDGLQVAKEILSIDPEQRIIFASAYVKKTLEESVKELKRVVELMQKPFSKSALVDTVEDIEAYRGLNQLMNCIKEIEENSEPTSDQIRDLFEGLRKIQKHKY